MDPIWIVIAIAVLVPVGVVFALAKSAQLRGPAPRHYSQRPVGTLVTDAIPEEHPEDDEDYEAEPPSPPPAGPA